MSHFAQQILSHPNENTTVFRNIDLVLAEVRSFQDSTTNSTGQQNAFEAFQYEDLYYKLLNNFHIVTLLVISTLTNIILLLINCRQKHNRKRLRLSLFLAHLGFINICVSVGLILAVFVPEVLHFQTYSLEYSTVKELTFSALREFIRNVIGEKFICLQSLFLLFISIERYLSLFPNYKPSFKSSKWFYIFSIFVYILLLIIVDHRLLVTLFGQVESILICIAVLILPTLLAFAFDVSALVHLRCQQQIFYRNHDISFIIALLLILTLQLIGQVFITLESVHYNFTVDYVISSLEQPSDGLNRVFNILYKIGHYLFLTSPLYISVILLAFVHQHREAVVLGFMYIIRLITCLGTVEKVDYSSETMRSILAEQTKSRSFRMYPSTAPLSSRTHQTISLTKKV